MLRDLYGNTREETGAAVLPANLQAFRRNFNYLLLAGEPLSCLHAIGTTTVATYATMSSPPQVYLLPQQSQWFVNDLYTQQGHRWRRGCLWHRLDILDQRLCEQHLWRPESRTGC